MINSIKYLTIKLISNIQIKYIFLLFFVYQLYDKNNIFNINYSFNSKKKY